MSICKHCKCEMIILESMKAHTWVHNKSDCMILCLSNEAGTCENPEAEGS